MWAGALGPGFEITGSLLSQPPHAAPEPGDAQIHHKTSNASGEQEGLEDDMGQGLALGRSHFSAASCLPQPLVAPTSPAVASGLDGFGDPKDLL